MDEKKIRDLSPYHRRAFLSLLIILTVALVFLDLFFLGPASSSSRIFNSASGYIQAIVSALIVFLFMITIYWYFLPSDKDDIILLAQLSPTEITSAFERQLELAGAWGYRGNFGRYLRGKVLPTLADRTGMRISVCIIDPTDEKLCEEHSRYRSHIHGIDKGRVYTAQVVQFEVLITIIVCAWYVSTKAVSIDLYLTSVFEPIRVDASDKSMILTVEDRRRSALLIEASHFMYDNFKQQMSYVQRQAKRVSLEELAYHAHLSDLTVEDIQEFFEGIGMHEVWRGVDSDRFLEEIKNVRNPYAN